MCDTPVRLDMCVCVCVCVRVHVCVCACAGVCVGAACPSVLSIGQPKSCLHILQDRTWQGLRDNP
jgi:hypothetical protein